MQLLRQTIGILFFVTFLGCGVLGETTDMKYEVPDIEAEVSKEYKHSTHRNIKYQNLVVSVSDDVPENDQLITNMEVSLFYCVLIQQNPIR